MTSKLTYGIDKDINAALDAKLKTEDVQACMKWLGQLTGQTLSNDMHKELKSGVVLCNAMNKLQPNAIKVINRMNQPFMQRENITNFLEAARKYGVRDGDLFVTEDLFDGAEAQAHRLVAVVQTIMALGGAAKNNKFNGPTIGVEGAGEKQTDNFKFTVKASGDTSVVSKQVMGSSETQPEHYSLGLRGQIVKTDDAGATGVVSKQTSGSVVQNASSVSQDHIIRSQQKTMDTNTVSKQNQGSIVQPAQQRMDNINRLNTTTTSTGAPKPATGPTPAAATAKPAASPNTGYYRR